MQPKTPNNAGVGPAQTSATQTSAKSKDGKPPIPTSFPPCRVLVVEDVMLIATALAATLSDLGHQVIGIAPEYEQALAMARKHLPDLIMMDIHLGNDKPTGIDAAQVLYSELGIPSVLVTAYSQDDYMKKIYAAQENSGVFGYVIKPPTLEQVRVAIGVAMQRAAVQAASDKRIKQLMENLEHRRMVERAKWVLVEKRRMTEQQAHDAMQKLARDQRRKLIEIAEAIVAAGDLPG